MKAGVIPLLIRHLDHSSSNIRKDSAWALSNIMAGTEDQIQRVIDADALPPLAVIIQKVSSFAVTKDQSKVTLVYS